MTDFWVNTGFGTSYGKTYQNPAGNGNRYFRLYTNWNFYFTKGFGQTDPDPGDEWAGTYDQDRIDLLLRMADEMKSRNPGSVVIFNIWQISLKKNTWQIMGY